MLHFANIGPSPEGEGEVLLINGLPLLQEFSSTTYF